MSQSMTGKGQTTPELVWDGKYGKDGRKVAPLRGVGGVLMFGGSALAATVGRYALTQSVQPFTRSDGAGARIALSADGSTLVTGAPNANGSHSGGTRTGGAGIIR
jgi:hypothetical protein